MPDRRVPPKPGGKQIGGISTKWWLLGGGAAVLVVAYSYRKAKNSAATTTPAALPTDAAGVGIDPTTGMPYGNAADAPYYPYGDSGMISGSPYGQIGNQVVQTAPAPLTNADWYAHAVAALESHGYTAGATKALAEYLMGLPLTPDDLATVQAAIALVGPPPNYIQVHTVGQFKGITAGSPGASAPATPTLTMQVISGHRVQATASKVSGAAMYAWRMGSGVPSLSRSNVHVSNAYPVGQHYGPLTVRAISSTGKLSGWSAPQTIIIH